jgi:regulator of sirC expression with transglutaminase-like and TPR domain
VLAVDRDPTSFWARFALGRCDLSAGRADDSLISFAICVGIDPNNPAGHLQKALAHARLGQRESAISDLDRVLQIEPNNPQAISLRESVRKLT